MHGGSKMNSLAQRLKLHDPDAMAELYDRYGRLAFSVILAIVRDRGIAEDLTQEVFLRIWNNAANLDEERNSLVQWVAAVARNRAYDYVRSVEHRMKRGTVTVDALDLRPAPEESAGGVWREILNGEILNRALACLTVDQRTTLSLWYRDGLTHAEIARQTRVPLGTVKTRLRTTLRAMRKYLEYSIPKLATDE